MKKRFQYGAISFPIAKSKVENTGYYIFFVYGHFTNQKAVDCWNTGYLISIDYSKISIGKFASIHSKIKKLISDEEIIDTVKNKMDQSLSSLVNDSKNAFKCRALTDSQLLQYLSMPSLKMGKLAQLSDSDDIVGGVAGYGAVSGVAEAAAAWGTGASGIPIGAIAGGATTSVGLGILGMAATSFAGGYMMGKALNPLFNAMYKALTGDESPGDTIYELTSGDSTSNNDNNSNDDDDTSYDDNDTSGDDDTSDDDSTSDGDTSDDDDTSYDDNDTSGDDDTSDDDDDTTTDAGTTLPPDLDYGSDGVGWLMLYFTTKLGLSEARRQLRALDILAGGAVGAPQRSNSFQKWIELDLLLGGYYIKEVKRSLDAQQGKYGLRFRETFFSEIDVTKINNYGLVNPNPLDLLFLGETARTLGYIR